MNSVARLISEHDLIERALALLDAAATRIESGKTPPEGFLAWAPRFFQEFADQCHHAKEEDVFFPLLKERGIPEQHGPIGCMLHEHVLGRECVARMRGAANAQPVDGRAFAQAARQYIPLLTQHIFKENNVLFRMAEQVMSAADDAATDARFRALEHERGHEELRRRYIDELTAFEARIAAG